ncbi:MAG TPA: diacylglycerol kinase family protein [Patescibacteria group bacterium]|nr:diacylglycerol kinase family protein [Patescibacteria group bacterium]
MGLRHTTLKSFSYAFQGLNTALKNEPNFRIHLSFSVFALILGLILKLNLLEWLFLTFTIFFVLVLELLNTVLEAIVNTTSPEVNPYAKIAKDVAAACVLLAAAMSIIVGIVLFLPKIITILT